MQKRINRWLLVACLCSAAACSKTDNFPGPDSGFQGRLIDKTTGQNFVTETGSVQIRLEELSWSSTPAPQTIPSKYDGTFQDTKLFSGHYRVTPVSGSFWPVDPIELDIKGNTTHDFELTPYLRVTNLTHEFIANDTLVLHYKLEAPVKAGLPTILDVTPYVNITPLVGAGANIVDYSKRQDVNRSFDDLRPQDLTIKIPPLKQGRTFYIRVGVRVDDSFRQSNLSEIIQIAAPK